MNGGTGKCPECGALPDAGEACDERFHACLVLDFSDPAYGAVHHLVVATYMLQHPSRLTAEGWLATRTLLQAFLQEGRTPAAVRREDRRLLDSGARSIKLKNRAAAPVVRARFWPATLADVRRESGEAYCASVTQWATAALAAALAMAPEGADRGE
jgi:hypothetical protein